MVFSPLRSLRLHGLRFYSRREGNDERITTSLSRHVAARISVNENPPASRTSVSDGTSLLGVHAPFAIRGTRFYRASLITRDHSSRRFTNN